LSSNFPNIIQRKRDGKNLRDDELRQFVEAATALTLGKEVVPAYQISALLMAIYFRGMDFKETLTLTRAIADSGQRLTWDGVERPLVDKHSTGGVGDKLSLIVVPLLAACGAAVPKLSGRGLGHTGGTLDKLSAIPGLRLEFSPDELNDLLRRNGCFIAGHGAELAPADATLYHLRDVTATVESLPLVVGSIIGKKLAAGADSFVIDVKVGRGALFPSQPKALRLARWLKRAAEAEGRRCVCVITDMSAPLGRQIGNANEVDEALDILGGSGSAEVAELSKLCVELAAQGVKAAGLAESITAARVLASSKLADGTAREVFEKMIAAQGGDLGSFLRRGKERLTAEVIAPRSGWLRRLDALTIGRAAVALGAGRRRLDDELDLEAGVEIVTPRGAKVSEGEPLLLLRANSEERLREGLALAAGAVTIGDEQSTQRQLVRRVIR
jgi:thymidine phosphorylase